MAYEYISKIGAYKFIQAHTSMDEYGKLNKYT
jgi:hypothetical protein